jgi:NAD-dependent SIR2 family protein deacetylase
VVARKGYEGNSLTKSEYKDDPEVLKMKVKVLANILKESKNCVFYSGAGISTRAGVPDYASKDKPKTELKGGYRTAKPTGAHHAATALHKKRLYQALASTKPRWFGPKSWNA